MASGITNGAERAAFIESLEALLRPLMPLALNYGVTYTDAQDVLRSLFIDSMSERIREQGRQTSSARLAVMAGLNRGEVEKISESRKKRDDLRAGRSGRADQVSMVLNVWHDDQRFNTPYGAPLDLSLKAERGFKTVDDLIEIACPGADRDLLLDEMVTSGCVEVHGHRFIRCTTRTFLTGGTDTASISRIGRQGGALSATFAHNVMRAPDDPSYFERYVVSASSVNTEFRTKTLGYLREHGQQFIERCDRWISEAERNYEDNGGKRVGIALYFYEEAAEAAQREIAQ